MQLSSKRRTKSTLHRNMYVVHCAVDGTASIAGGLISLDIDASLIYSYSTIWAGTAVVSRTSISTHILHRSILVTYWYWEAGYTWTALVYTYVQVLPVCTGQSVLYVPLYRLAARHLLLGQSRRVRRMVIW